MSDRKRVNDASQYHVLYSSARRCCLCYGIDHDYSEKKGQIAHLDQDPSNSSMENLVWLCLPHHDQYDSKNSQTKNYTRHEIAQYRDVLYQEVSRRREIPDKGQSAESARSKKELIENNLAIFFFAALTMYEPPMRDLLLKEIKDPDFRSRLEDAWRFLSEPLPEEEQADLKNRELGTRLYSMAKYLSSSSSGREDLRILLAIAGTAISAMDESQRNKALFAIHDDSIRSTLMLVRKISHDKSG